MTTTSTDRAPARRRAEAPSPVRVTRVTRLTPHLVRITLTGPTLRDLPDAGPDQRFKLLLPRPGQPRLVIAGGTPTDGPTEGAPAWFTAWREQPADVRPIMRTYTIRRLRPADGEVDVDFALHDTGARSGDGPATAWARRARVGDWVAMSGTRSEYTPPPAGSTHLIVGDDTALPAIANILERLPEDAQGQVFLEVAGPADRLELAAPAGVTITWTYRNGGGALLEAVRASELPAPLPYAWIAGERDVVKAVRAHLVGERGLDPSAVTFSGYWRRDGAIDPS